MRRVALVALALLAGCGGADRPSVPTEPQGTEPDKGSPGAAEPSGGKVDIAIRGRAFRPAVMRLRAGQIIVWTNEDKVPHTVVGGGARSGAVPPHGRYELTPLRPGRLEYRCTIHPEMRARLVVAAH
jgi:plastocyanin